MSVNVFDIEDIRKEIFSYLPKKFIDSQSEYITKYSKEYFGVIY